MSDDTHLLAAGYALDTLSPEDRRRFESHVAECDECRRELQGFTDTAARLAAAVAEPPPPALRARVLAEVAATRQVPPAVAPPPGPVQPGQPVQPFRPVRPMFGRRLLVAAAAAVVVVAVAVTALVSRSSGRQDDLLALLRRPDVAVVDLAAGTPETGGPVPLRVVWAPSAGSGVVVGAGLQVPADDRVYELWRIGAGAPEPAGTFRPSHGGDVEHRFSLGPGEARQWAVTVEPEGGSAAPTGPITYASAADA